MKHTALYTAIAAIAAVALGVGIFGVKDVCRYLYAYTGSLGTGIFLWSVAMIIAWFAFSVSVDRLIYSDPNEK